MGGWGGRVSIVKVVLGVGNSYMHLNFPVPFPQLLLLLGTQVLVSEEDDASFSDQKRQLIPLLRGEILKLESFDLSADVSGEICHFCCCGEQVLLRLVRPHACILIGSLLIADLVNVLQVERCIRLIRIPVGEVNTGLGEAPKGCFGEGEVIILWFNRLDTAVVYRSWSHYEGGLTMLNSR